MKKWFQRHLPSVFPTDEQFIAKLRSQERLRKRFGPVFVVFFLAFCVFGIIALHELDNRTRRFYASFASLEHPTTEQTEPFMSEASYRQALMIGFAMGMLSCMVMLPLFIVPIAIYIPFRRDRLLLECWNELHPASEHRE